MAQRERADPARADPGSLADVTRAVLRLASGTGEGDDGLRPRVLVLSDGTSVLSRGDLGVEAVRPMLERKCDVIERATAMSAFPLTFAQVEPSEFVRTLELLRSNYDAILIVDIADPRCFELRRLLGDSAVDCPVSNNLATPGLLLAACELGLRRLSMRDLRAAADYLTALAEDRPDASPVPRVDPGLLARSIADAIAEGCFTDHRSVRS